MGLMRFVADDRSLLTEDRLGRAYVAGLDELPTNTRTFLSGDEIVVERPEHASGCFSIPWPIPDQGDWMLATTSLMERDLPYNLEVELARGLVYRVRDQLATWESLGLVPSDEISRGVQTATSACGRAAIMQHQDRRIAAAHAREALEVAGLTSYKLCDVYSQQALGLRMADDQKLTTLLGVRVHGKAPRGAKAKRLAETFNLVNAACDWGAVEKTEGRRDWSGVDSALDWARQAGMRLCIGPLLEFDDKLVPDWAYLWEGDQETLTSLMLGHVRASVERYRGKVQLWHVAAKVNRDRVLSLNDEQRLQMVANAVRLVRQLDPATPIVVGIDQPWGEYRSRTQDDLAPLDFADALERAELGIAGFELEVNIGCQPHGTELRNPLAFSRMIDLWNIRLESPLMLSMTFPCSAEEDPAADSRFEVVATGDDPQLLTPDFQSEWARRRIPMILAKNAVQVLIWSQLTDRGPHRYPNAGLYDDAKNERPILTVLHDLRKRLLA